MIERVTVNYPRISLSTNLNTFTESFVCCRLKQRIAYRLDSLGLIVFMMDEMNDKTNQNSAEEAKAPKRSRSRKKPVSKGKSSKTDKKIEPNIKIPQISASAFPRVTINESIDLIQAVYQNFGSNSVPWDTAASLVNRGAKTSQFKYLMWSTESYGLLIKDDSKNYLLTELGRKIVAPTFKGEDKEAILKAILTPSLLSKFYNDYDKHPLPEDKFLPNVLWQKYGLPESRFDLYKQIIISNAEAARILKRSDDNNQLYIYISGFNSESQRNLNGTEFVELEPTVEDDSIDQKSSVTSSDGAINFDGVCFVITPIGEEGTEHRKHADLLFHHLINPVIKDAGLKAVRADTISKPGIITQQIFEYLVKSKLCICDLSYNNPNVFYELGIRHMSLLPNIQIIRKGDKIPFDVSQGRTIIIDLEDKFTIIDRIESAKRELTDQLKAVTSPTNKEVSDDNPVKYYLPGLAVKVPK